MMIHEITEKTGKYKSRKRIGRGHGSGSGKTSGRGHKGAKSRAGYSRRPGFEGGQMQYFRRIPKRGFTNAAFKTVYSIVNVAALQECFKRGATIDATTLVEAGLIRNFKNPVKILGEGELSIALNISAEKVSTSAQKKIEDAGGSVTIIEKKKWKREYPEKVKKAKLETPKTEVIEETAPTAEVIEEVVEETAPEALAEEATEDASTDDAEVAEEPNLADDQEGTKE